MSNIGATHLSRSSPLQSKTKRRRVCQLRPLKEHALRLLKEHALRPLKENALRPLKENALRPLEEHAQRLNAQANAHTNVSMSLPLSRIAANSVCKVECVVRAWCCMIVFLRRVLCEGMVLHDCVSAWRVCVCRHRGGRFVAL